MYTTFAKIKNPDVSTAGQNRFVMSFATFRIVLFARTRDDGTRPVYLRLTYKGKSKYFPLGLHTIPANWDKKLCRFTRDFPEYKKENDLLRTYEQRAAAAGLELNTKMKLPIPLLQNSFEL